MMDAFYPYLPFVLTGVAAALFGAWVGWRLGRRSTSTSEIPQAYRENLARDFAFIRVRAQQIVTLANEIGGRAGGGAASNIGNLAGGKAEDLMTSLAAAPDNEPDPRDRR